MTASSQVRDVPSACGRLVVCQTFGLVFIRKRRYLVIAAVAKLQHNTSIDSFIVPYHLVEVHMLSSQPILSSLRQ